MILKITYGNEFQNYSISRKKKGIIALHYESKYQLLIIICTITVHLQLLVYDFFGNVNLAANVLLLILAGLLVNGPYALITTAVSAELGTHPSLGEDSKALATVTAIIDGTGSIGAAVGPMIAGFVSSRGDPKTAWHNVYYLLIASEIMALLVSIVATIESLEFIIIQFSRYKLFGSNYIFTEKKNYR